MLPRVPAIPSAGLRRAVAAVLLCAGAAALLSQAVASVVPLSNSVSLARKFWRAGPRTRLLNTRFFAADLDFTAAALGADRAIPREDDVLLVLPRGTSPEMLEERRRRAAYLLAPRRVVLGAGDVAGFRLDPLRSPP